MRPVTAPLLITRPCTLPSSFTCCSHELTCAYLFCSIKYSLTTFASGRLMVSRTASSTIGLPFSVTLSKRTPSPASLFAICCLEPTLKTSTLSLSFFPVFSDHLSWTMGGNFFCNSSSMSFILSLNVEHRSLAKDWSRTQPFFSCCCTATCTLCSSSMLTGEKQAISCTNFWCTASVTFTSCMQ